MEELLFAVPFSFWDYCFSLLPGVRFERLFCADASVSSSVVASHVWRGCGRFRMACGQTGPGAGRAVVNGALRSPPCGLPSLLRGSGVRSFGTWFPSLTPTRVKAWTRAGCWYGAPGCALRCHQAGISVNSILMPAWWGSGVRCFFFAPHCTSSSQIRKGKGWRPLRALANLASVSPSGSSKKTKMLGVRRAPISVERGVYDV